MRFTHTDSGSSGRRSGGWLLLALWLICQPLAVLGGDPANPVPARYCSDTDQLFWYMLISDTHFGANSQDSAYLQWAVTEAKQVIDPAFIVVSGDITDSTNCDIGECGLFGMPDGPHLEEWLQYRDALCLDCPQPHVSAADFFDLPGNHDQYSDGNFSYYLNNSVQGQATGRTQSSWTREYAFGKYHFLGLNTAANDGEPFSLFFPYGDNAGLDGNELTFIESELIQQADADITILFGHHAMDQTPGVSGDTWLFYGASQLAGLMNDHGVSAYGYGHTHRAADEFFTGGVDDETGTPYTIDPQDPERGIFYFNVSSLAKEPGDHLTITAIDCNGISSITRDAHAWPMVLITAPVDIDLGVTDNPFYRDYTITSGPANPVRALVFDTQAVSSVAFQVDGGAWQPMTPVNGRLWQGGWDASGAAEGIHTIRVQATGSAVDSDEVTVYLQSGGNQPPVAAFDYLCDGLACSFDASASQDPDGSLAGYAWDFGDGNGGSGVTTSHLYAAPGSYAVNLTVTDDGGLQDTAQHLLDLVQTLEIHVGDLDGSSEAAPHNRWNARVTIFVHDATEQPAAGVTVSGSWSDGASGDGSCLTGSDGGCSLVKSNLKANVPSLRFTVNGLEAAAASYLAVDNHDPDGDSDGTSILVYQGGVPPANQPPVAEFSWNCSDLLCIFDASASSDPDGSISGYAWDFGDGGYGSGMTVDHTYAAAGSYTVGLTVTDDQGATDSLGRGVSVGQGGGTLHVGDLDGTTLLLPRSRWTAQVDIRVHDDAHLPIPSATVSGSWSGGTKGDASCTTGSDGLCRVEKSNLKTTSGEVVFTVTGISHDTLAYGAPDNHDPESDSDGSSIILAP